LGSADRIRGPEQHRQGILARRPPHNLPRKVGDFIADVTPTGMGIVLTEITPNDRAILERWVASAG